MVSVGEHDVAVDQVSERVLQQSFHGTFGANGHVDWCSYITVAHGDCCRAAPLECLVYLEHEGWDFGLRAFKCRFKQIVFVFFFELPL